MQVILKQLIGKSWHESKIDVGELSQYSGHEAVALIADGFVWVGNDKWYKHYEKKGYMVTNHHEMIPIINQASIIFRDNKVEREAIMITEGIPEEEIKSYILTQPGLYGEPP